MAKATVAAVQAAYVLMDREATLAKTEALVREAAAGGADLVAFPEVFVPGTPIWIDAQRIWDGDDAWYAMLVDQAVVVPGPVTDRLGQAARDAGVYLVVGIDERERHGTTIYNSVLYFGPDGALLGKHRKLVPTGSERTVWGMGDGSTLQTYLTPFGQVGGLTCWENYMPLARFFVYSEGVDIWIAPTLAGGDAWIATLRHIAREGRCYVVGVNPVLHVDQIPSDFPNRDSVWTLGEGDDAKWAEPGNTVIIGPTRRSSPALSGTRRRSCTPRSTWQQFVPSDASSTRSATITAPTCSGSPSTLAPAPQWLDSRLWSGTKRSRRDVEASGRREASRSTLSLTGPTR